jgi:hypothetical protein
MDQSTNQDPAGQLADLDLTTKLSDPESDSRYSPNDEIDQPILTRDQAADRVRNFYLSGIPFFTKDAIADLASQLDRAREAFAQDSKLVSCGSTETESHVQMISLRALDGEIVNVRNRLGEKNQVDISGPVWVV